MEKLNISGTNKTPTVICDADLGLIEFDGMSYSEDNILFYEPVFNWLNEYLKNPKEVTNFNMKIRYLNSSAVKCIFDMLELLTNLSKKGKVVHINWHFEEEDEEMKESGKNYSNLFNHEFNLIAI